MQCKKCRTELPEGSVFCLKCGAKQTGTQRPKSRGNGQGSVYQLPNKTWIAVCTVGYDVDAQGKKHRRTRSKAGFKTKREAVAYLPTLAYQPRQRASMTFQALY